MMSRLKINDNEEQIDSVEQINIMSRRHWSDDDEVVRDGDDNY